MRRVKLSVSLSDADVAALDEYAESEGLPSRSAALQRAIRRLPRRELTDAYAAAWDGWDGSADARLWADVDGDGDAAW